MDIGYLIQLLSNKLDVLAKAKEQAFLAGDLNRINGVDSDIYSTQDTLAKLKLLADLSSAATGASTTPAEVVSTGLDVINTPTIQGPSAGAVINGYDVSAYATDPSYEDKIRAILSKMPTFSVVGDIDTYIQSNAQGSPVIGDMVYKSTQQYGVDLPLTLAIMQNDSGFGTLGIGARTFNPGNVGNTGSATQTYPTWQDGVNAVTDWLNRHRVVNPTVDVPPPVVTPVDDAQATSTDATTTPPVIVPTTPVVPATSTLPFTVPTINATTTPIINNDSSTSTDATSTATSTLNISGDNTGSTTTDATSTIDLGNGGDTTSTSTGTTTLDTNSTNTNGTTTATTTDPSVVQFEVVPSDASTTATTTKNVSTSSPQARRTVKSKKKTA